MLKAHGLRKYFYEYVFYKAIEKARYQANEIVPISQAKLIRARVDELLTARDSSVADPRLEVAPFLEVVDQALTENVDDYEAQFPVGTIADPRYLSLQQEFAKMTGVGSTSGNPKSARLPISPYDPQWSPRATVKHGGTALLYIPDETITRASGGKVEALHEPRFGNIQLWGMDDEGKAREMGPAMTLEDASGLSSLMPLMSEGNYFALRNWVFDGGRDPRTNKVDLMRFMSAAATARSVAVLEELQEQGIPYEVVKDIRPGQIKARVLGTGLEVRLTDVRENEDYAGSRIYDNGMVMRYSTNHRVGNNANATYSPTPDEAVSLLRVALGQPQMRQDLPQVPIGAVGHTHPESGNRRGTVQVPDAYFASKEASMFAVKDYVVPGERARTGSKVMIRSEFEARTLPMFFNDADIAATYIDNSVQSARGNLEAALQVDELIAHWESQQEAVAAGAEIQPPEYSGDSEVGGIQRSYWDVLTGARDQLLRPGYTTEVFTERLEEIGEFQAGDSIESQLGNLVYSGTPAEKIRDHASDVPFELIGTWEPSGHMADGEWVEKRFDPTRVARYMDSGTGQWSNLDNLAAALRRAQIGPEELLGQGFQATRFKDHLGRFDANQALPMAEHPSEFMRKVGQTISNTLHRNASEPVEISVDPQGIITWSANKLMRNGESTSIKGTIGQVFEPGVHGEITTNFPSGENYLVVPGYDGRIVKQRPGENKSVEERTRLRGYEQIMLERVRYQITGDVMGGRSEVGEPGSLNGVYSHINGTKHPVDFLDRATTYGLDERTGEVVASLDEWTAAIVATEARRVRYGNDIKAGSTIFAEFQAERDKTDPANDNHFDAWRLTQRNMAVLTGRDAKGDAIPEGYFDPVMTGGATNQGIVRYLTQDAVVLPDGSIAPGDSSLSSGARAPLMNLPELETLKFDPFDRQQMTALTIMQSSKVTAPVGTALMTFGGWTADDPIVVSNSFAADHQIRGAGGALRDLVVGDKISDLHGNKGVISLIVDRDMPLSEALDAGITEELQWFKENPDMDVVMSPFSLISRRNAGSARELMSGPVQDLKAPIRNVVDDTAEPGDPYMVQVPDRSTAAGVGQMRFVVTHMAVDEKTKVYDDAAVRQGKGRKASSQLAWALQSQDCPAIMGEFYGHNSGAEAKLREYLNSVGMGMDADGTLRVVGQAEATDEMPERRMFEMPELDVRENNGVRRLNRMGMRKSFAQLISDKGGDLEIPFQLNFPTGESVEAASGVSWKVPVLSSHLRSGQEFDDGTLITHDYTRHYLDVHTNACVYRFAQDRLDNEAGLPERERSTLLITMSESTQRAQSAFDTLNADIQNRHLTGKNNIFKTGLMSSRLSDSATMVWTADPRLDIDQVALSSVKAAQLGLKENDHALVWRDPVLRDAGVRYLRVAIDDRLTGAAINPVMDACFDGDFDGDAVGVAKLHTASAHKEALAKLTVPANLLDKGVVLADGTHPLAMQLSLDTQVALSKNPELAWEMDNARLEANILAREDVPGDSAVGEAIRLRAEDVTGQLSDMYRQAQRGEFGSALTFSDREAHLQSIREVCVETKAKGSEKKLGDYARNFGDEEGNPGITQADQEASMFATAIKAQGTGLGGSFSQRAVRTLREDDLKAVLELTYPVTQSILQAKHDAAEARHKYEMLQGPGRELWRGRKLEDLGGGSWKAEYVEGAAVQATTQEWKEQFIEFYESPNGFNVTVNPEYVDRVAEALTDKATGRIRNLEEDPTLAGTLMDRMAYGGDFDVLKEAALKRESIYDGSKASQFAPAATKAALAETEQAMSQELFAELEMSLKLASSQVKPDVTADHLADSRVRGGSRRSEHVATARVPASRLRSMAPTPTSGVDDDYGMGF